MYYNFVSTVQELDSNDYDAEASHDLDSKYHTAHLDIVSYTSADFIFLNDRMRLPLLVHILLLCSS